MDESLGVSRKEFLTSLLIAAATGAAAPSLSQGGEAQQPRVGDEITLDDLRAMQRVIGTGFSDRQLEAILGAIRSNRRGVEALRQAALGDGVEPPTVFVPFGSAPNRKLAGIRPTPVRNLRAPASKEDLAFLSVRELGHLVRTKRVSPVELTRLYLDRLATYGEKLLCVVTLTEERALKAAKVAEEEIVRGRVRGPLHGIPCGIKDLFALRGYPTTWGSEPHRGQVLDFDAAVVERLDAAGAVIVAKLSLGALAQGDVWFRGRTKNPWNPQRGSSGSSAGSASATAAGLVAFAIGTETLGSIMSPSHECRVTGLRPTYGRVSRYGAMAVSWTMDKIGPICRNAEDCALVFSAIHGADPRDRSSVDRGFQWRPDLDLSKLRLAFLIGPDDDPQDLSRLEKDDYLRPLVALGAKLSPLKIAPAPQGVSMVLGIEAAASFDDFTRSEQIDLLTNSSWPQTYRANRFVSAVDYLRAQRVRQQLMASFEQQLGQFDAVIANERGGQTLLITNLTGHPQVLVPNGTTELGVSRSVSVIGRLYDEATALAVAHRLQQALGHVSKRPDLSKV